MSEAPLTWVLLVPMPVRKLTAKVKKFWQERFKGTEMYAEQWEVLSCRGRFSAVLDRNPGSELSHEVPLIRELATEVKEPIYLLYMNEDYEGVNVIEEYRDGRKTKSLPDGPYDLARRLGCNLPGEPATRADFVRDEPAVYGLVFAEGIKARDATRALDLEGLPADGPLQIEDSKLGALIYNREKKTAPPFMIELSEAFPKNNIYTINSGPGPDKFNTWVARAGKIIGDFNLPELATSDLMGPKLDAVKGNKMPEGIASALGIPFHLLNLKRPD